MLNCRATIERRNTVARGIARRSAEPVRVLGMDDGWLPKEARVRDRDHDLEEDRVLWVGDHRREETLRPFWASRSTEERRALRAIVMDRWQPYIAAT